MVKLHITSPEGVTTDATELIPTVTWSGDYQQCARTLELGLLSSATDKNVPVLSCPLGSGVLLTDSGRGLFSGYIFTRQKATSDSVIDLSCYDRGIYVKRCEAVYKFTNMTPEAITARICADFGIEVGAIAETGVKISRNFIGVSLHKIIQTAYTLAAEATGEAYLIRFEGAKLCVIKKAVGADTLVLEGGSNLMSAATTESVAEMINRVGIFDSNGNQVGTQSDEGLIKLYGLMQSYLKQSSDEDSDAKAKKLLEDNGVSQKITVENLGDVRCITGNSIVVREPYTGVYGLFWIDGDVHTWKNGQYYNKLTLNFKRIMDEQEAGSLPK